MKDILSIQDGKDLGLAVSLVPKAVNVLDIQLQDLEYAQTFGVDKRYFLNSPYLLQVESYKAYLVKRLAESQINIGAVIETVEELFAKFSFHVLPEIDFSNGFTTREIVANVLLDADGAVLTDADGSPLADIF